MNTRHLYTFQDGDVIVLEHIVAINTCFPNRNEGMFFQVDMIGDVGYCHADVEFDKLSPELAFPESGSLATVDVLGKTTERAKLIKALAAI